MISSYDVPVDTDVMLVWGELTTNLEKQGRKMPAIDSLIAAIAVHGKLSLVTRSEGDFRHADVPITNAGRDSLRFIVHSTDILSAVAKALNVPLDDLVAE
jgi:hypothetical protein